MMGAFDGFVGVNQPSIVDATTGDPAGVDVNNNLKVIIDDTDPVNVEGTINQGHTKLTPLGYEQVTAGGVASGLTVPAGATLALIQNDENGTGRIVRWRDDGTDPTAALGMRLYPGGQFEYGGDLSAIKFIKEAGADVPLNISYYKDA